MSFSSLPSPLPPLPSSQTLGNSLRVCVCVDNVEDAYALIRDLEPGSPQEYILKAVANTVIGQEQASVSSLTHSVSYQQWFVI